MPLSDETKLGLTSTEESSVRARRIAFFMQIAVILTVMAVWQQLQGTWLNRRLEVAQAAEWALTCRPPWIAIQDSKATDTSDVPNEVFSREQRLPRDWKTEDKSLPLRDLPQTSDVAYRCSLPLSKLFPARESRNLFPAFLSQPAPPTQQQIRAYLRQWHFSLEEAKANVADLQHALTNRVLAISIPVLGISFDLNDLSVLSGFSFIILLSWFSFSLRRYRDNVRDLFRRTSENEPGRLADVYDLLRMTQVLTVPDARVPSLPINKQTARAQPGWYRRVTALAITRLKAAFPKPSPRLRRYFPTKAGIARRCKEIFTIANFILFSSFAAQLAALWVDLDTSSAGDNLNATLTDFENWLAIGLTTYVLIRTLHCRSILSDAAKYWEDALRKARTPVAACTTEATLSTRVAVTLTAK